MPRILGKKFFQESRTETPLHNLCVGFLWLNYRWKKRLISLVKKGGWLCYVQRQGESIALAWGCLTEEKWAVGAQCMENEVSKLTLMEFSHRMWRCLRVIILVVQKKDDNDVSLKHSISQSQNNFKALKKQALQMQVYQLKRLQVFTCNILLQP